MASAIAFLFVSCFAFNSDLLACSKPGSDAECKVSGVVRDYKGKLRSIAMWEDRNPRYASSMRDIVTLPVFEMARFLSRSPEFQVVLEKLESDRKQTYSREKRKTYVPDPKGKYVRETGVALWIPKDPSRKLGIYKQPSGEPYFYSNYASSSARELVGRFEVNELSRDAKFHLLIHTHPWGTVPSDHDQETARRGIVSMVLSEKGGEPTVYIFQGAGPVWEVPTRLFKSREASKDSVFVAQN